MIPMVSEPVSVDSGSADCSAEPTGWEEPDDGFPELSPDQLRPAPAKMDDLRAEVQDELVEVNLGTSDNPKPTYISKNLSEEMAGKITDLLHEFKDCFAWDYSEMPGLDRSLVEHQLPIKDEYRPYKQPPRRLSPEWMGKIKEEIERLLDAGFFRPIRYAEWLI